MLTHFSRHSPKQKCDQPNETERALRTAPKPKPKFDPITGKWVVKSWDGSVAGIENGEMRSFDDLMATRDIHATAAAANAAVDNSNQNTTHPTNESNITNSSITQASASTIALTPFALIDEVFPNSPASSAGIQLNDLLLQFDSINATNHENFGAIARLLPRKEGESVVVKVRRKKAMDWGEIYEVKELMLEPKKWEGRGLLGCHISKYDGDTE
jgi:hypothetical protein